MAAATASLRHVRARAVGVRRASAGATVQLHDGHELTADAVVVATGLPGGRARLGAVGAAAVALLRRGPVGARRPRCRTPRRGRTRRRAPRRRRPDHGRRRPLAHAPGRRATTAGCSPCHAPASSRPPTPTSSSSPRSRTSRTGGATLAEIRDSVAEHVARVRATGGDWRPALDGLRFRVSELWQRLSEEDRAASSSRDDASDWNRVRHRMPPSSAAVLRELATADRLRQRAASVVDASPLSEGGLRVTLSDGSAHDVGWVVNCTGPALDVRHLGAPAPRRPAHHARRCLAGPGRDRRHGVPHPRRPPARLDRPRRCAGLDARRAAPRRAVGVHRRARDPQPGARPGGQRARRDRAAAAPARGRSSRQRPPPGRPAARPARPAAVRHGRGRVALQRRPRDA